MYRLLIPHIKPSVREIMIKSHWVPGLSHVCRSIQDWWDTFCAALFHRCCIHLYNQVDQFKFYHCVTIANISEKSNYKLIKNYCTFFLTFRLKHCRLMALETRILTRHYVEFFNILNSYESIENTYFRCGECRQPRCSEMLHITYQKPKVRCNLFSKATTTIS